MAKSMDIPSFGVLKGVKIFSTGSNLAQPWAASLMAQYGANVIQTESTLAKEATRLSKYGYIANHQNIRNLAININTDEGKDVFTKLIQWCDIWMEASKAGTYDKWGLTDEYVWSINPKCIIVHVSGFGQTGDPNYVKRGSIDTVGQAFSGYMQLQGKPDEPVKNSPFTCDYICALYVAVASLSAYINMLKTGQGESIDMAQYEAMLQVQSAEPMNYFNSGIKPVRTGNAHRACVANNVYKCKDGNFMFISAAGGAGVVKKMVNLIGLGDDPSIPTNLPMIPRSMPEVAEKVEKAVINYCADHTAAELDSELAALGIPCSMIMTYEQIMDSPHYAARENIVDVFQPITNEPAKLFNVVPKFKNNPGQYWRGAPLYGMDNDDILDELGYNPEEIASMYEKSVIKKG